MLVRFTILLLICIEHARLNEIDMQLAPVMMCIGALSVADLIIERINRR